MLAVIGFHAFPEWIPGGFVGVDVFFVISGYLISSIIFTGVSNRNFSFFNFYSRRIRRIFPALIVVLVFCYGCGWFILFSDEFKQLGKHIAGGAGFISNFLFWTESGYFDNSAETKPLLHLWSLAIEEQFYIVWPILIWLAWRRRIGLFALMCLIWLGSFLLNLAGVIEHPIATFYSPQTRAWELLTGALLAWSMGSVSGRYSSLTAGWKVNVITRAVASFVARQAEWLREVRSLIGVSCVILAMFFLHKKSYFPGWWALLPVVGALLIISAGQTSWLNRTLLSSRLLVWFGLISFPLYLWHWPLLSFAHIVEGETPSRTIRLGVILISIALAWLTYRFVEKLLRYSGSPNGKTLLLVLIMIVVGYVGYNSFIRNGLIFRDAARSVSVNNFNFTYRQTCEPLTLQKQEHGQDWCNIDSFLTLKPSIALIGDSFSNAYTTVLTANDTNNKNDRSFIQVGRALCPMLINYGPPYCQNIAKTIRDYIVSNKNIKIVILASYWPFYYSDKSDTHWPNIFHIESLGKFKTAFEHTITDYEAHGKKVVVFHAPPNGATPKACIERPFKISERNTCNISLEKATLAYGAYRTYMVPKLKTMHVNTFDPFLYLCTSGECKVINGQKILYEDAGHLSVFGGEYLAAHGGKRLDMLLR